MTATASPLANLTNSPSIASPTSAQKPFDQLEEPTTPVPPPPPPPAAPAAAVAAAPTPASTVRAALGAFAALKHPLSASGVGVLNVIAAYLYCFEPNVVAASLWLGLVAVITGFYWTWVVGPPSAPPAALTAAELQPALERAVELYNRGAAASLAVVRATEPKAALAVAASLWAGAHAAAALGATFFVWAALDLVLCGPPLARALAARPALLNHAAAVGAMVRGLAAPQLAQVASLAEEKNAKLGLFGGACLAVLYYVFVVPLHHKLLIAGVAGLASRAFPALKGALLTNPTNLSVATIVSSLGGDGDASVVALAAVTAATKARARRMSISAVEFAKRNATPHKKKPSAMHAHAE